MTDREATEAEIRQLLVSETKSTVLSNKLFQQGTGLFTRLASTEAERRALVETELFRTAQARVRDLQYRDAALLSEAMKTLREKLPDSNITVLVES